MTDGSPTERVKVRRRRKRTRWWPSRHTRHTIRRRTRSVLRVVLWVVVAAIVVTIAGLVYAGPAVLRAQRSGRSLLLQGRDAVLRNDLATARSKFAQATAIFGAADNKLGTPLLWPVRATPVASTNLLVARSIASVGTQISAAGESLAASLQRIPGGVFRIRGGTIPLSSVVSAADALDAGANVASDVGDQVNAMPAGWVVPALARYRDEVRDLTPDAADAVTKAQAALHDLPNLLGQTHYKRYLIAFSNLSELRGSGGLIGYVTELDAKSGHMGLTKLSGFPTTLFPQPGNKLTFPPWFPDDFRRQAALLQNVNLTTDFPTVGNLLLQAVRPRIGPMDGVIAVDPAGVAAVLALTGPIRIHGWRPPITAATVAQVMQHDVYTAIPKREERDAFFGLVVRTAFAKLVGSNIVLKPKTVGAFDAAVQAGHFRMYSADANDQAMFQITGLAGNVDRASGASDGLSVVTENSSGNKEDWYLTKKIRYTVELDPRHDVAQTALDVDLVNTAPTGGLPAYVIGAKAPGVSPGENRLTFMLVRSARDQLERFTIAGRTTDVLGAPEGHLSAYRTGVLVPPGGDVHVQAFSRVSRAFFGPKRSRVYRLRVLPQAVAHPDTYEVSFTAAKGWHVVGPAHFAGKLGGDLVFDVRVAQTTRGYLLHVITAPFRLAARVFRHVF